MPSYEESKKEVEKFMGQGQSQFVSLKELIEDLQTQLSGAIDKIHDLENDLGTLRNFISNAFGTSRNFDGKVELHEVTEVLEKWANGD